MAKRGRRFEMLLHERDDIRARLVRDIYGNMTLSDVFRAGLVALCRQLGLEKDFPDDRFIKK
jgi:hypothetical protein